jgi:hypothetical protein
MLRSIQREKMRKIKAILKQIWFGFSLSNDWQNAHQPFGKL